MFGTYRTLLALTVVFVHFTQIAELSGLYAVFGFFVLSGYLMTLIMTESYGFTPQGVAAYAVNRFLRIYPIYWFACLIAMGIILLISGEISTSETKFYMPETAMEWLQNFGLLLRFSSEPQIIQPAWTLTIELFFYGCIGIGASRTKTTTGIWLAGSLVYTIYIVTVGASDYTRFFTLGAASLPFSIGAALYHWRDGIGNSLPSLSTSHVLPGLLFAIYLVNIAISHALHIHAGIGFYLNIGLCTLMLTTLIQRKNLPLVSRKADALLGDLSYPIYLIHAPFGWLLLYLCKSTGIPITDLAVSTFFAFLVPIIIVAWVMTVSIEKPIELARSRIKRAL